MTIAYQDFEEDGNTLLARVLKATSNGGSPPDIREMNGAALLWIQGKKEGEVLLEKGDGARHWEGINCLTFAEPHRFWPPALVSAESDESASLIWTATFVSKGDAQKGAEALRERLGTQEVAGFRL